MLSRPFRSSGRTEREHAEKGEVEKGDTEAEKGHAVDAVGDHPLRLSSSSAKSDADLGPGSFGSGSSPFSQSIKRWKRQGVPSSWGTLMCLRPALRPRRDQPARPLQQVGTAQRTAYGGGSPRFGYFGARSHGISTRCLRFAVRLTPPHARLASGCGPRSTRPDWIPVEFLRKVSVMLRYIPFPFPKLLGADGVPFSLRNCRTSSS